MWRQSVTKYSVTPSLVSHWSTHRSGQIIRFLSSPSTLQIVALTVYSYFLANLLGLQYIESRDKNHDYYFPVFGSLQFVFYVGWLKVAETLINPFGEDDDDFDTNFIVDRNIQFTFLLIDQVSWDLRIPEIIIGLGGETDPRDGERQVLVSECAQGAALHSGRSPLQTPVRPLLPLPQPGPGRGPGLHVQGQGGAEEGLGPLPPLHRVQHQGSGLQENSHQPRLHLVLRGRAGISHSWYEVSQLNPTMWALQLPEETQHWQRCSRPKLRQTCRHLRGWGGGQREKRAEEGFFPREDEECGFAKNNDQIWTRTMDRSKKT